MATEAMDTTGVEQQEPVRAKVGRPPGRPRKEDNADEITISKDDLAKLVAEQVQQAMAQQSQAPRRGVIDANGTFVGEPRNGMPVPVHTIPPEGWEVIPMTDGTGQLWQLPPANFNKRSGDELLKLVDKAFADIQAPIEGFPHGRRAGIMRVNERFHEILPSTKTNKSWGDDGTSIVTDPTLPNDRPLFTLERLERIDRGRR